MSIIYSTIRTLILDKAINAFFNAIAFGFSNFDILNGIREFDEIQIYKFYGGKQHTLIIAHDSIVKYIRLNTDGTILIRFSYMYLTYVSGIKSGVRLREVSLEHKSIISISDTILKLKDCRKLIEEQY